MSNRPTRPGEGPGDENSLLRGSVDAWIVVGLGSNIPPRETFLEHARRRLRELGFPWSLASDEWENRAIGGPPGQGDFLNQVLAARCESVVLSPRELLKRALEVERELGRRREHHWGPRTLDVDILFFGTRVLDEPGLIIPHPRVAERDFVLRPLAAILPRLRHPVLGSTAEELLARLV